MVEWHYLQPSCGLHCHDDNHSLGHNNDNDRLDCEFDCDVDHHFRPDDVNNGVAGAGRLVAECAAGEGLR